MGKLTEAYDKLFKSIEEEKKQDMRDSTRVLNAFVEYEKTENKSLILHFTAEEIEKGLMRANKPADKERRYHKAMELRYQELINQLNRADERKQEKLKLLYALILGVIGTLLTTWLIKQFF